MTQHLTFTLCSPLAAHGTTGAMRYRGSWPRPGRSAVLGLVAGSLGLRRDEYAANAALSNGYGYAVRVDSPGRSMVDYHSAQMPGGPDGRGLRTRRAELEHHKVGTVLTYREYRQDAIYTIALWAREGARWTLEELSAALQEPVFAPYLGRKCAALSLPMAPTIVEADTLPAAFAQRPALHPDIAEFVPIPLDEHPELACDTDAVGIESPTHTSRRDGYQGRRVFAVRPEYTSRL